ncbi:MAG TPA: DUF1329 domain-containing protein [Candidatus Binatia bacterium]|jgi:hypothetical protein|nr:DUF1329 domain-containing protein [Candidatus Binatia bacterium]
MTRALLATLCALTLAATRVLAAGTPDQPWPPDPKKYAAPGTEVAPGLKVGDTLDQSNADKAKDLLPPEILKHYQDGGYKNEIASWPEGIIVREKSFNAATASNEGKYDIDPATGTIIDKATGKAPEYAYGIPFPTIKEDDPNAGIKAVWNMFYNYWNNGSYHFNAILVWTSPSGKEREALQDVYFQYYLGQSPAYRVPNEQGFAWQAVTNAVSPADLQGTATLNYRWIDPTKRDALWTYVPALRRVRAVSPSNRSDGVLGSDLGQDDGHFFDGKPEDFEWKTIGLKEGLRISEPYSIKGQGGPLEWMADGEGGWRDTWPKAPPVAGYLIDGWKGVGWAPTDAVLTKRKFWVVEATPRDRYYLYGKMELWIDAESWIGAWNRKSSWKGELLNVYQVQGYLNHPAIRDGQTETEYLWSSQGAWQCAEAVKSNRATLAGLRSEPTSLFDRRVKHNTDQLFDMQTLSRWGK